MQLNFFATFYMPRAWNHILALYQAIWSDFKCVSKCRYVFQAWLRVLGFFVTFCSIFHNITDFSHQPACFLAILSGRLYLNGESWSRHCTTTVVTISPYRSLCQQNDKTVHGRHRGKMHGCNKVWKVSTHKKINYFCPIVPGNLTLLALLDIGLHGAWTPWAPQLAN